VNTKRGSKLHDPRRCEICRRVREAVARGEITCIHPKDATECELCLLGIVK